MTTLKPLPENTFWRPTLKYFVILCIVAIYGLAMWQTETNPMALVEGIPDMLGFVD